MKSSSTYTATCELCERVVFEGSIRSMTRALGRHRDKVHPDYRGTIKYKTAKKTPAQIEAEAAELIAAHKEDRAWNAEQDRKWEEAERVRR
jgi:Asp/Glu/hydantoin racemase